MDFPWKKKKEVEMLKYDELEEVICSVLDIKADSFNVDDHIATLENFTSLKFLQILMKLQQITGKEISFLEIQDIETISDLLEYYQ